ncbi:DNA polymerase III subunit delta' [Roseibacterium sp. SDUM158016]|uniref:DNA polymerase III subunit delta' n=1 Tax=Roseicyclus sediminis TaxID=2980997 RepID=UPI0021D01BC2|nr:DNA polymerase III subunit delta' [Roseibacterium sp. SDUM158016]MCU4652633.1 DNA polymerase III subunit delta' [Roseibacterium sp. SDUM158016]
MSDDTLPEPDRVPGAPHPRETLRLFGQATAEATFLDALNSGRLPHGWLLTGPKGVGKASFAWRAARYLVATPLETAGALFAPPPANSLDVDPAHPVARRIQALSEPSICLIRRSARDDGKALSDVIRIDDVRRVKRFFSMAPEAGQRRVVIVDAADEMNPSAANALLKELEEPPANTVLFLVAHQPSALLPTIRSRCRTLRFDALSPPDLAAALEGAGQSPGDGAEAKAVAALSGGSVGAAVRLLSGDGAGLYGALVALLAGLPEMDRQAALKLSDAAGARGADERFELTLALLDTALARIARTGATGAPPEPIVPGEDRMLTRLAPDARAARDWAELAATLTARARRGRAVNLDPAALIFDMFLDLDRTAARLAVPAS